MSEELQKDVFYTGQPSRFQRVYRIIAVLTIVLLAFLAYSNRASLQEEIALEFSILPLWVSALIAIAVVTVGILLLVPNSILFVTTGAFFGSSLGLVLNLIGFVIGSSLAFLIARTLAHDLIERRAHSSIVNLSTYVSAYGWKAVALLRIVPVMPTFLINYLLGATQIKLRDYAWASAVFMIPSCFVITYAGATGRDLLAGSGMSAGRILFLVGLVVGLIVLTSLIRRKFQDRLLKESTGLQDSAP